VRRRMKSDRDEEDAELYLRIADMLLGEKVEGGATQITQELHVSGQTVKAVKDLIDNEYIALKDGEPVFTKSFKDAKAFLEEFKEKRRTLRTSAESSETPEEAAQKAVREADRIDSAEEAVKLDRLYKEIGKAIYTRYAQWAARRGMDVTKIKEARIDEAVMNALDKEAEFDKLVKQLDETQQTLKVYAQQADPAMRAAEALRIVDRFAQLVIYAEAMEDALGYPLLNLQPVAQYYNKLLTQYMKGEVS